MKQSSLRRFLSDAKFYEAYSRYDDELERYETWYESVERVMTMHRDYYKAEGNAPLMDVLGEARTAYRDKLILGSQRVLQFGGAQVLKHEARLYNCTASYVDRAEFFGESFYLLLCGAGVGFSVQKHHVKKLPGIIARTKVPKLHVIEDSIEGWATSLDVLLSSFFEDGGKHPEYSGHRVYFDMTKIRPKGSMISGGFKAPGPDPLRLALDRIEHLLQGIVLKKNQVVKLKPIHAHDIIMHASDSVLSGGVRRSACISLFSPDDEEMLSSKTGNWYQENPQRARANNSAVIERDKIDKKQFKEIIERIKEFGEPGFYFVDSKEQLTNPCVEIGLYPQFNGKSGWQFCNLTEINGGACNDEETFYKACRTAAILGTIQAGYTNIKFINPITQKILKREALLGVSITGWMSNPDILFDEKVLKKGAEIVLKTNKEIAAMIGINETARATCVKPSGTASVLLMTPAGIHPEHSPLYIRNVQMNKETEVAQVLMEKNPYMVEESAWSANKSDYVVSFPITSAKGSIFKDDIPGVKHLELVKKARRFWVEPGTNLDKAVDKTVRHNVSNTIVVDNWDDVADYVWRNRAYFSGVSFISTLGDKVYYQAPNTRVLTSGEIVRKYKAGGIFASGLIVDGLKYFDNLWLACATSDGMGDDLSQEDQINTSKRDWIRRFENFALNYFDNDKKQAEYCLKDVYLLHKWEKIIQNFEDIQWEKQLVEKKFIDADTLAAGACVGTVSEYEGCFI